MNVLLKLCQNKKGQTFVGMLIFWNLSFGFQSAAFCKKERFKNRASQQRFGFSYFVRTLDILHLTCMYEAKISLTECQKHHNGCNCHCTKAVFKM